MKLIPILVSVVAGFSCGMLVRGSMLRQESDAIFSSDVVSQLSSLDARMTSLVHEIRKAIPGAPQALHDTGLSEPASAKPSRETSVDANSPPDSQTVASEAQALAVQVSKLKSLMGDLVHSD